MDWAPPVDAILIDFNWERSRGEPSFNGLYRSRKANKAIKFGKSKLYEVDDLDRISQDELAIPLTKGSVKAELPRWQETIRYLRSTFPRKWDGSGCCIALEDVAELLGKRRRRVLNVLDERGNFHIDAKGEGVSGFWYKPDIGPGLIRVYHDPRAPSITGGPRARYGPAVRGVPGLWDGYVSQILSVRRV